MSVVANNIIAGASGQGSSDYEISRSLRFNSSDTSYLEKSFASAGNRQAWTWSGWVKKGKITTSRMVLFGGHTATSNTGWIEFGYDADRFYFTTHGIASNSTRVFRDLSAWHHVVVNYDGVNLKFYTNNVEALSYAITTDLGINSAGTHRIGRSPNSTRYLDGYIADVHFIDGQTLAPTEFGKLDDNNVWQPKEFAGKYTLTNPNDGSTWSSGSQVTGSTGLANAGNMFNGNTSNYTSISLTSDGYILWTPSSAVAYSSKVEIYTYAPTGYSIVQYYSLNGGTETTFGLPGNSYGWTTVATGSGSITSLKVRLTRAGSQSAPQWGAIRVDGVILQDGVTGSTIGGNSFRLSFDDNSSNAALGASSSDNTTTLPGVDFDGSGDHLSVADSTDLDVGLSSEPYTIEAFVYMRTSKLAGIFGKGGGTAAWNSTTGHQIILSTYNNNHYLQWWNGSSMTSLNTTTNYYATNTWYHVAVSYDGTTTRFFVDGQQTLASTASYGKPSGSNIFRIGDIATGSYDWDGVISNFRLVKGTALYTSNFTAPTAPLANVTNTKLLCCQSSSSTTASAVTPGTITAVGNPFATTQADGTWTVNNMTAESPTSLTGVDFDGNDRLTVPSFTSAPQGTSDWTIEFYAYFAAWSGNKTVTWAAETSHPNYRIAIQVESGKYYIVDGGNYGSSWYSSKNDSSSYTSVVAPLKEWHHVAIQRASGVDTIYIDGQVQFTASGHTGSSASVTGNWIIGGGQSASTDMVGKLSNFRVLSGTALYSSTFTPPTTPLTNITNTVLLCCQSNSSATAATVSPGTLTTTGDPTAVTFSDSTEANDCLVDTPTNYGDDTGAGGEVRGNYCTINPLLKGTNTNLANGNLEINSISAGWNSCFGTFKIPTSGKWFWEVTAGGSNTTMGLVNITSNHAGSINTYPSGGMDVYMWYGNGNKYTQGAVGAAYGTTFTTGAVVGTAFDADAGTLTFYLNGVSQGVAFTGLTDEYIPVFGTYDTGVQKMNFGARPWIYAAPSGYKALCTQNLSEPVIADGSAYFDTKLFTGNGSSQSITGLNFSPDLVWIKSRSNALNHRLVNTVDGNTVTLSSNLTAAGHNSSSAFTAFTSDGFNVTEESALSLNASSVTYAAWTWDAGSSNTSVSVGGLNSSVYDQSQTWSTYGTHTGTFSQGGNVYDWDGVFGSGELYNSAGSMYLTSGTAKWTLTSSYACTSEVKFYQYGNTSYTINEGLSDEVTSTSTGGADYHYHSIPFTGNIASIKVNTTGTYIIRIFVDGKALIDSGISMPDVPSHASTVRANPSAGFSIVTFTGYTYYTDYTLAHGLNAAPEFIIARDSTLVSQWAVYHSALTSGHNLYLNQVAASATRANTNIFVGDPTSTHFTYRSNNGGSPHNGTAFCFSPVSGFSSMGSYLGNGSTDGPFVYTGFKVAFFLVRSTSTNRQWGMFDAERLPVNGPNMPTFYANSSAAETTTAENYGDFLSNGVKIRATNGNWNGSGETYVYLAFAENPFSLNGGMAR